MARRRYFRYYPRTRVAKKKWASNFKGIAVSTTVTDHVVLVENTIQNAQPTPTIIKTGNFKVHGDAGISNASSTIAALFVRAFILFVPEGWDMTNLNSIPTQHPEWIMAWTAIDLPVAAGQSNVSGNKFSLSSRLKRNLNSGDKVVLYFDATGIISGASVSLIGAAQYWTCAN